MHVFVPHERWVTELHTAKVWINVYVPNLRYHLNTRKYLRISEFHGTLSSVDFFEIINTIFFELTSMRVTILCKF